MQGRILKVSGPLVVGTGIPQIKMYDVVLVGKEKLIGEVIKLEGDKFFVQVYENTSGLAVDDPIETTNEPLSVELGPGLLTTIYDGIQRPLEKVEALSGYFIQRGVVVEPLDRKKVWDFVATKKVKDKVVAGDIIGYVQETPLIKHYILVPPDIEEGEIIEIKSGKYTIEDVICKVSKKEGIKQLKMYHKWPVRKPLPYKEKLPPTEPLFTGQRVIDTFFPVGKGGTSCVPGPFGSGKCVSADTPVFLADGRILTIKEIFEQYKNSGKKFITENEEYIQLEQPIEIFSYCDGKIKLQKATGLYKGKTNEIIHILTRTGREAEITPQHKLLKLTENLEVVETEAKNLKEGDYILVPRKLKIENNKLHKIIEFLPTDNYRVKLKHISPSLKKVINAVARVCGSEKKLAEKLNVSYNTLIGYYLGKNNPTISFVKNLFSLYNSVTPKIKKIKAERQSKEIKIPNYLDKEFAIFLGLLYSDGSLKKNTILFYNNDSKILKLYSSLVKKLFGIKTQSKITKNVKTKVCHNKIISDILKNLGFPEYKKSNNCYAPTEIFNSSEDVIGGFLGAYYICDGYFDQNKGAIEIVTASNKMATSLLYLCLRLGILAQIKKKVNKNKNYYRIVISGREEIKNFYEHCNIGNYTKLTKIKNYLNKDKRGYTSIDVVPISAEVLQKIYKESDVSYKKLKEKGVEIHNYLNGELMSKRIFNIFCQYINDTNLKSFAFNHLNSIFCDKIVKIEKIETEKDVYDLEVPYSHNFIGGTSPMIFHNTIIQHQLAKWADADIVVYVGCGERGNEMTDVLIEFPELKDPKSGLPLLYRTVLIANTSNMPVAAREASIYTGITIAEYFRDMGYSVALMADSTSRWAEALREISGRLEEMPGEEGYPAYLPKKVAEFYERAGKVKTLGSDERIGSLTVTGAVSPPGGDLSDPVVQATLKVVKVFWSLEDWLAYARHFPAINWLTSYSLYYDALEDYYKKNLGEDFVELRNEAMAILQKESELKEIVRLVGYETLSEQDKLILEIARMLREDFLYQSAFDPIDTYCSGKKQYLMLKSIIKLYHKMKQKIDTATGGITVQELITAEIKDKITKLRFTPEGKIDIIEDYINNL